MAESWHLFSTDYVDDLYECFLNAHENNLLEDARKALISMTPANMDTMLENEEGKDEAVKKWEARKNMVVENVPPTAPGEYFSPYY